jgi:hypothetical protein
MSAVASASVMTHSSWPVIPFLGIQTVLSSCCPRCEASLPPPIIAEMQT